MPREDSKSQGDSVVLSDEEKSEKFKLCLRCSHAVCITQGRLKLIAYPRGHADEGEAMVQDTGIVASNTASLQIDEGSGRIVISDVEKTASRLLTLQYDSIYINPMFIDTVHVYTKVTIKIPDEITNKSSQRVLTLALLWPWCLFLLQ